MELKRKVPVYESEDQAEIDIYQKALEKEGIATEVEESLMTFPFSFLKRNSIKLMVDIMEETRAFTVIDGILQGKKK